VFSGKISSSSKRARVMDMMNTTPARVALQGMPRNVTHMKSLFNNVAYMFVNTVSVHRPTPLVLKSSRHWSALRDGWKTFSEEDLFGFVSKFEEACEVASELGVGAAQAAQDIESLWGLLEGMQAFSTAARDKWVGLPLHPKSQFARSLDVIDRLKVMNVGPPPVGMVSGSETSPTGDVASPADDEASPVAGDSGGPTGAARGGVELVSGDLVGMLEGLANRCLEKSSTFSRQAAEKLQVQVDALGKSATALDQSTTERMDAFETKAPDPTIHDNYEEDN
jgi:hypothetical protein